PTRSRPPPTQLSFLMNPLPDAPDDKNPMISTEIYRINNLKKKYVNSSLPTNLTTILTRRCDNIEALTEKQNSADQVIKSPSVRVDAIKHSKTTTPKQVGPPTYNFAFKWPLYPLLCSCSNQDNYRNKNPTPAKSSNVILPNSTIQDK
ncbi:hypothetical protein O181_110774, partial [Austropuccinia psidii MF-1]|nr:hypothetical protein [Austropuccinia psidii MF-1]